MKQVWFANGATGAATCHKLREWWDHLSTLGPSIGYHPNASKTNLAVKEEHKEKAKESFANS